MKTEKLNLAGIKNVLSRSELRNIMAGSNSGQCTQGCGSYATTQCGNYGVQGQFCYYQFYEDCVSNCTQL
ncbi:MAG: hypothetical protein JWQ84_1363 [Mucilaginibacter sp.]|nr:hypothetical protein [Mucilaginibacter sp.]